MIAKEAGLVIENPSGVKQVSMALLTGGKVRIHDPYGYIADRIPDRLCLSWEGSFDVTGSESRRTAGIWVDDTGILPPGDRRENHVLCLRPRSLYVGIGCNRGTEKAEIRSLVQEVFKTHDLCLKSLAGLAGIFLKKDEKRILETSEELGVPVTFFEKEILSKVTNIPSASRMVEKHTGVKSVCEAAAIQAAGGDKLVVRKQKTTNATVAVSRKENFMS